MPSFTLTVDAAIAARIAAAFGRYWNLKAASGAPRDATAAEVKSYLVRQLKAVVIQQERAVAEAALSQSAEVVVT